LSSESRMPSLFIGHGNPMNALQDNAWTRAWSELGGALPRPKAVLCVSAHWYLPETAVTGSAQPRTLHDFGGFPPALYQIQYGAPGMPELAARVAQLLSPEPVRFDSPWGLDHGAWSVLVHLYPNADVPVIQLSINETKEARGHFDVAARLRPLRDEGVLILGSGNLVHNLHAYSWGRHVMEPYDWALRFESRARELLLAADYEPLVNYEQLGSDALLSVPTPEHYLPLLYVLAQHREGEPVGFPVTGFDGGSISMLAVQVG
jgi:4,5-DOPA dioxygenase extradiol